MVTKKISQPLAVDDLIGKPSASTPVAKSTSTPSVPKEEAAVPAQPAPERISVRPHRIHIGGERDTMTHNNHHQNPRSAKFSVRPFEFDMGWAYIWLFQKMRLAKTS